MIVEKETVREFVFFLRKFLSYKKIKEDSKKIKEFLFNLQSVKSAKHILFYLSFDKEVETYQMIEDSLQMGKSVYFPLINKNQNRLEVGKLDKNFLKSLIKGPYGIPQPSSFSLSSPSVIQVLILPVVGIDSFGHRVGWGFGYYDSFVKELSLGVVKIALAFEFQFFDIKFKIFKKDIKANFIITEKRVFEVKC